MGMWHVTKKLILLLVLSLKGIIRSGGGQRGAHKVHGLGKSMLPVGSYLVWEGGLHEELHGMIAGADAEGWARRHTPRRMPPMID